MILNIIIQCILIFLGTVGLSIIFNIKSSELLYCGLTGSVCYFIYMLFSTYLNKEFYGIIIGIFVSVLLARRFSYIRKIPTTLYIITAVIPLAPGGALYLTMYNIISGDGINALMYAFTALKTSSAILIGMTFALTLPNKLFNYKISERKK